MGLFSKKEKGFYACTSGTSLSIENVPDEIFASKMMGDGIAIIPNEGNVYAPCAGKITVVMENSKHAIGIETTHNMDILLHIGIDTVELLGEGFHTHVNVGDFVNKGDLLVTFDQQLIKDKGYNDTVMMIVTQANQHTLTKFVHDQEVKAKEDIILQFK